MTRNHKEDSEQKALIEWADLQPMPRDFVAGPTKIGEYLFAIPNGGYRNAREAARLKAQGVRAGVSDLFFAFPTKKFHGLFIEMKVKPNKPTQNQSDFMGRMFLAGYMTAVCYGVDEAIDVITWYVTSDDNVAKENR